MADFDQVSTIVSAIYAATTVEISITSRRVLARHAEIDPGIATSFEQSSLTSACIEKLREQAVASDSVDLASLSLLLVIFVAERDDRSAPPTTNTAFNIAALLPSVLPASGELAIPFARDHLQNVDSSDSTCWYLFTSVFAISYPTQCIDALKVLASSLTGEGLARCSHLLAILTKQVRRKGGTGGRWRRRQTWRRQTARFRAIHLLSPSFDASHLSNPLLTSLLPRARAPKRPPPPTFPACLTSSLLSLRADSRGWATRCQRGSQIWCNIGSQ